MNNNGWLHAMTYSAVQKLHSWPKRAPFWLKRCIEEMTVLLASITDIILCWLAMSAKQRWDPCSGPPTNSTNYWKCISNLLSSWVANQQCLFWQANHGTYSNPGTQVGPGQGFWCCFADRLNQILVSSVGLATALQEWMEIGIKNSGNWILSFFHLPTVAQVQLIINTSTV